MNTDQLDVRNAQRAKDLHPLLLKRFNGMAGALKTMGFPVILLEGLRTHAVQEQYFAKGRTVMSDVPCRHHGAERRPGKCTVHPLGATVTNALPGYSWHQFGLAFDAAPDSLVLDGIQPTWNPADPEWKKVLEVGRAFKLAEGATWRTRPDYPHFYPEELAATPSDAVREMFKTGGISAVWLWATERMMTR